MGLWLTYGSIRKVLVEGFYFHATAAKIWKARRIHSSATWSFSPQKYLSISHYISFEENLSVKKRASYCLNQRLVPKRAAKFAKRASCGIRWLELFNGMTELMNGGSAEWWNILGRRMTEYPDTKVSKNGIKLKSKNCFQLTSEIKRSIGNHCWSPEDKGNNLAFGLIPLNYCYIIIWSAGIC